MFGVVVASSMIAALIFVFTGGGESRRRGDSALVASNVSPRLVDASNSNISASDGFECLAARNKAVSAITVPVLYSSRDWMSGSTIQPYPLSSAMIREAVPANTTGELAKVLLEKLTAGVMGEVRVGVMGGSFTMGIGCYDESTKASELACSYGSRTVQWMADAFRDTKIVFQDFTWPQPQPQP
jgi:hypothetical protein